MACRTLSIRGTQILILSLLILLHVHSSSSVLWDNIQCAPDGEQAVPEGRVADIGRFPWLGLVQHSFEVGGKIRYAVTPAILVHPAFAIAAAADMAKIPPEHMANNTVLLFWKGPDEKYALNVVDYILHSEFQSGATMTSLALLQLLSYEEMGVTEIGAPVLPICMPIKGSIAMDQLYAIKMTDENGEMEKAMHKMSFVDDEDCEEFYTKAELMYDKMIPKSAICAVRESEDVPCVWDAGTALVTRQNWGYWTLLGFGVRGPGCGAPAKFLVFHDYLPWINQVIDNLPFEEEKDMHKMILRHKSPVDIIMYKSTVKQPLEQGQCDRKLRGSVIYKENHEILVNKNFAQGFFFSTITEMSHVACAFIRLEVASRTNAAIWLEHNCHRDMVAAHSMAKRHNVRMQECFLYFKTAAFLEFRFYFSFKASIDVTIYGERHLDQFVPNPNPISESTYAWWPTDSLIKWEFFFPYGRQPWNM